MTIELSEFESATIDDLYIDVEVVIGGNSDSVTLEADSDGVDVDNVSVTAKHVADSSLGMFQELIEALFNASPVEAGEAVAAIEGLGTGEDSPTLLAAAEGFGAVCGEYNLDPDSDDVRVELMRLIRLDRKLSRLARELLSSVREAE
jgi:hypothetical protein